MLRATMLVAKAARSTTLAFQRTARTTDGSAALEPQQQISAVDRIRAQMMHGPCGYFLRYAGGRRNLEIHRFWPT